jgi:hypothetical protein
MCGNPCTFSALLYPKEPQSVYVLVARASGLDQAVETARPLMVQRSSILLVSIPSVSATKYAAYNTLYR